MKKFELFERSEFPFVLPASKRQGIEEMQERVLNKELPFNIKAIKVS